MTEDFPSHLQLSLLSIVESIALSPKQVAYAYFTARGRKIPIITVYKAFERMETRELIFKQRSQTDHRGMIYVITQKGVTVLKDARQHYTTV